MNLNIVTKPNLYGNLGNDLPRPEEKAIEELRIQQLQQQQQQ